jgi:ribosome-binding protein aMBF1 (putative translation factor)
VVTKRQSNQSDIENEGLDDIEAYISTFDGDERRELEAAEVAIDIAIFLHRARQTRGLSQAAAAQRAGLKQQAVSRFERPDANPRLDTVQAYLGALGFAVKLDAVDIETGEVAASVVLPPTKVPATQST